MNPHSLPVVLRNGEGRFALALSCAAFLMSAVAPSGRAQGGESLPALQARSQALDDELGREMRRLQFYLSYVDQALGLQVAQGSSAREAKEQLAQIAAALYHRGYTESDLQARVAEHESAGQKFFRFIEQQIASSGRWPADRAPQDYRAMAKTELQAIRAQFSALRSNPAGLIPILSRAAQTLGWTRGEASVSGDRDPFAQSAERVITALTEEHGRHAVALSRGEQPGRPAAARPVNSAPTTRAALPPAAGVNAGDPPARPSGLTPLLPDRTTATADVSQLLADANSAFGQSNLVEARRLFELALQTKSDSADALIGLGRCQNSAGELDAAIGSYTAAQRVAPGLPNVRAWIAELCLAKGEPATARRWLDDELRVQPNSAWGLSWLGTLEQEAGNPATAQQLFQRAAQLDPGVVDFRYQSANWMGRTNQPRRALRDSLAVIAMNPNHAGAYFAAASCSAQLGRADQAVQYYERYLQFDGASEWSQKARAEIARLKSIR